MSVTQKEIVEALRFGCSAFPDVALADRIEREGIAPPNGWELVPTAPTKRMLMCFKHEWITNQANECYEKLLTAAPKPEVKP